MLVLVMMFKGSADLLDPISSSPFSCLRDAFASLFSEGTTFGRCVTSGTSLGESARFVLGVKASGTPVVDVLKCVDEVPVLGPCPVSVPAVTAGTAELPASDAEVATPTAPSPTNSSPMSTAIGIAVADPSLLMEAAAFPSADNPPPPFELCVANSKPAAASLGPDKAPRLDSWDPKASSEPPANP